MTIYNFNEELPSLGSGPATSDVTFVYNTSSGRVKQMTVSQSRYKTVTASTIIAAGSSVGVASGQANTTSTTCFNSAAEGFVNIQATTSGGMCVVVPSAAGQELFICSPNPKTTGPFQIQVSSSYGSSSPSFDGTNTILNVPITVPWGVGLISLSTTKWGIISMTQQASTVVTAYPSLSTGG